MTFLTPGGLTHEQVMHTACRFCKCGRKAVALCDWKVPEHKSGTCDQPCCELHSKEVAPGKFVGPCHQPQYDGWKAKKFSSEEQRSLFGEAA